MDFNRIAARIIKAEDNKKDDKVAWDRANSSARDLIDAVEDLETTYEKLSKAGGKLDPAPGWDEESRLTVIQNLAPCPKINYN